MKVERLQRRLLHLQRLSAALATAVSRKEAVDAALDHGMAVFGASQAVVALFDPAADNFEVVALRGYSDDVLRNWSRFPNSDRYPLPQAVELGRPVVVEGPAQLEERYPDLAGTATSATLVCLPMGAIGGFALGYDRQVVLDEEELEFMTAVARQCAEAVQRAALGEGQALERAQKDAIVDSAFDSIITADHDGRIMGMNPAAERTFGWTAADVVGRTVGELLVPPRLREAHELALRRNVETGEGHILGRPVEMMAMHADGHELPVELTVTRVDTLGTPVFTAYVRDMTEPKAREQSLRFLAESGAELASSLDYRHTLRRVAELAVPGLADCCIVDVIEEGNLHQLALVHVDPSREPLVTDLETRYPVDPAEAHSAVGEVVRTGRPMMVPEVTDELLREITRDDEHMAAVRNLGMRSLIIAPLIARGRTLGAVTLIMDVSGRRYGEMELDTARGLADRAAMAIDNARLYEGQSGIASTLQLSLLPSGLPDLPGVDVAGRYAAAGTQNHVGGDFYDVWTSADRSFGITVGDVSGKGAEAASVTALARHSVRIASRYDRTPSSVLAVANDEMARTFQPETFCTMVYVDVTASGNGHDLLLGCAGHPLPLLRRRDGRAEFVGRPGTLLGQTLAAEFSDVPERLCPGELLVLYTDGVTERRNDDGGFFGEERLRQLVEQLEPEAGAQRVAEAIEQAVRAFGTSEPSDDTAILVIRSLAPEP
jgi:PAS domain S-box-containing protein